MRTIWKGTISFGLVSIPIRLFSGARRQNVKFNMLHEKCQTRIKYRYYCPRCDETVDYKETVRGYEYEKGRYMVVTDEEMKDLAAEQNRRIELVDFIELSDIDPIYYDSTYYVMPGEAGRKPYALLTEAMTEASRVGIGRFVMRRKPHLVALRPKRGALVMETMFYAEEIRNLESIKQEVGGVPPRDQSVDDKEKRMAVELIETLSAEFAPENYRNEYRDRVLNYIEKKAAGEEVVVPEEEPAEVIDLMDALQESLERAQTKVE